MRRQRTASESGEANGSENELNDPQRIHESSDNSDGEDGSSDNLMSDNDGDEDMESIESDGSNDSDTDTDTDTDIDTDIDTTDTENYPQYGMDYYDLGSEAITAQLDIMNQLQSALFGATTTTTSSSSTAMTQLDLERLRQQIIAAGGGGGSSSTHSNHIRSIIRSLPQQENIDPMLLYSTFTELWEMIVLTGEEVESYEFDTVVDLKPLLPHLLRVLRWDQDCQLYGGEFLLYAVRCTRACVHYSPGCARRLVERGLVPLITRQLFSVEYIDLAEDLIQIIQILTKSGVHSKACLHADGIRAVLGFIDFLALSVQVSAFTAVAQMTTALSDDDTLHLYLPPETAALLRATVRRHTETDSQVLKLVHQATQALSNAIQAAPGHVDELCPFDFITETVFPLASIHPLDSSALLLKLLSISKSTPKQLATSPVTIEFFKTLLRTAATNENLLETTLKLVIDLFCQLAQKPLQELVGLCLRNRNLTKIAELKELDNETLLGEVSGVLFRFYLNSPSISLSARHSTLCALLLLDDCQAAPFIDLVKMGALSRLLTTASSDPLVLVIGLEWCHVLSKQGEKFASMALRQGLPSELDTLLNIKSSLTDESIKKWLKIRLESINETVYSGGEEEEAESLQIYIKHFANEILLSTRNIEMMKMIGARNVKIGSVRDLLELLKSEKFTEYEWLGDTETCLARQLFDLLGDGSEYIDPKEYKPVCEAIYRALNRYDSLFTLTLPLAKLTRATSSNPLEALTILTRPLRVHLQNKIFKNEKMIVCDPFSSIGWIVKMGGCGEGERRTILRETSGGGDGENIRERVFDALNHVPGSGDYGIVDISSTAFTSNSLKVHLLLTNKRILLPPTASLIEILFAHSVQGTGAEKWKKINDIWSGGSIKLLISNDNDNDNANKDGSTIIKDSTSNPDDKMVTTADIVADTKEIRADEDIDLLTTNKRVKLALDLLKLIPFESSNDHLSSKLSKELDSPLLIAVNGISSHWIQTAQSYHFLYPFALRLNLMKSVCLGRLRALWILQQRTNHSIELNSVVTIPRRKFRIDREQFLKCLKNIFRPENCGDLRLFEFEYAGELGTGHGPTMEFYALASQTVTTKTCTGTGNGIFPSWKGDLDKYWYRLIGSLVARSWLDDRIIDIPINPVFLQSLINSDLILKFDHLKLIDQEIYNSMKSNDNLIGSELTFLIPGTEISLLPGDDDREIKSAEEAEQFKALLLNRMNECMIQGRESFLQGFNRSFPCPFHDCIKYFTPTELARLFSQSLDTSSSSDWNPSIVLSALVPDHGYDLSSPQIRWLAELIAETEEYESKGRLVRFLTGAVYLPIGGWKALRPPLTIVCKSDDANVNASSTNNISSISVPDPTSPSSSVASDITIHDSYLPSVMTCANYLKLPRYSSKEIMKERFDYAIKEGCDSFHLS